MNFKGGQLGRSAGRVSGPGIRVLLKSPLGTSNLLDLSAIIVSSLLSANVSHPTKIDFTFSDR